ncbi:MAG: peptidoglycan DD-metalloendopeptidase family protein [Chloroflexi bacterium]|nr:peptidoglycan DD-metalloendopeptidase family protein [Chloroflexota bacterium]
MQSLLQMGLGESFLRAATNVFSIIAIVVVIWLAQAYFLQPGSKVRGSGEPPQGPTPIAAAPATGPEAPVDFSSVGILRQTDPHTNVPSRPRQEIEKYTVQAGDTVIGIADKYRLQPKTIFAANYYILQDNPEYLQPGQELNILPVDGVYREWQAGEGLNGVASYYGVKPEDIINYPLNNLDPNTIGDYAHPNIKPGTWIIVPGGNYQYHILGGINPGASRTNPPSAQVAGPGACAPLPVGVGAVGIGTFVYPTPKHVLSGFDYSTRTNHLGIDLMGNLGDPVYAADGGVVVYAGWNNYGYGNMIMIDHGTGFQTLYAHLSAIFPNCGDNVTQGQTIGSVGSTGKSSGPHLHFEVRTASAVINPWNVLPAP